MHYLASEPLPLKYDPLKALVAPRPIGWISTLTKDGTLNLAPYSFYQVLATRPGIVAFAGENERDSIHHAAAGGEFVCSVVTEEHVASMLLSSDVLPRGVSEFAHAGVQPAESLAVRVPRVANAVAALECRLLSVQTLRDLEGHDLGRSLVLGQVVAVYIDDRIIDDGMIDTRRLPLVSRLGYFDYATVSNVFTPENPGVSPLQ